MTMQGCWDLDALKANFHSFEVEAISKVPINDTSAPDCRFWRWDKKGEYKVKTGYWHNFDNSIQDASDFVLPILPYGTKSGT